VAIYLVRHGETPGNAARVVQLPDVPLSDRGRLQARQLGARLATLPGSGIARVLASDLTRARETAAFVAEATDASLELDALLHERNFGDVRGTPYAELGFDLFGPDYAPPGGETWDVFHARVDRAWRRILEAAAETRGHLAVVTHGLVCRHIARSFLTLPAGTVVADRIPNTAITEIATDPPHLVTLYNCIAHLAGAGVDPDGGQAPA
jgi:probable phosphoglycerate mutase